MVASSAGTRREMHLHSLLERCPELALHLSFQEICMHEACSGTDQLLAWKEKIDLEGIEALYLFGLDLNCYLALKDWLHQKKERALIIFEEELSSFMRLIEEKRAYELLQDAQVTLYYVAAQEDWEEILTTCARAFPSDRLDLVAIPSKSKYEQKLQELRLNLFRKASLVQTLLSEGLYYHVLLRNLLPNIERVPQSFYVNSLRGAFKDVPAIICGAGPSLSQVVPHLKELSTKALIIAGGSAIAALSSQDVRPHIAMALDPNFEEYTRLKPSSAFEVPLFYSLRLHPDVFNTTNAPLGYMSSETGGPFEAWCEEKLALQGPPFSSDLSAEALSVTTLAVTLAQMMGCSPILFCGVDLAYVGMRRYADGVMPSSQVFLEEIQKETKAIDRLVVKKDRKGNALFTLVKWVMEAECLGDFAKKQNKTTFLHCTEGGLPIPNVPYCPLAEAMEKHCRASYDLRGRLHMLSQTNSMLSKEQIKNLFTELKDSLERCRAHIHGILHEVDKIKAESDSPLESGVKSLLIMDLQEEEAYKALLHITYPALEQMMGRFYYTLEDLATTAYRSLYKERELHKWKQMKLVVEECLKMFGSFL